MGRILFIFIFICQEGREKVGSSLFKQRVFNYLSFPLGPKNLSTPPSPIFPPRIYYGLPDKNLAKMCIFHFSKITYT